MKEIEKYMEEREILDKIVMKYANYKYKEILQS